MRLNLQSADQTVRRRIHCPADQDVLRPKNVLPLPESIALGIQLAPDSQRALTGQLLKPTHDALGN
jgi:hypothetical protein